MDTERELLKGNTPTLVLAVLREAPLHGYGIARAIERRSGSALRCREGTLYPALHALEREGLIAGAWEQEPAGRPRKVYSLTEAGAAALEERARAWERFATAVQRVLSGESDETTSGTSGPPRRRPVRPRPGLEPAG